MRLKFFTIPVFDPGEAEQELNAFLSRNRILKVDSGLVGADPGACWSICVGYQSHGPESTPATKRRNKVDYRAILAPEEFEVYAEMRRWRKEAAAGDGVPPYQVFTNEQLAAIIQKRIQTAEALGRLSGVGPARVAKYGHVVLERFGQSLIHLDQAPRSEDAPDNDTARERR